MNVIHSALASVQPLPYILALMLAVLLIRLALRFVKRALDSFDYSTTYYQQISKRHATEKR